ncbi:ABC transporter F family member 5 [Selaginella moellendorffii]|nr:ABC transporter F family member 5 [Selaginella moellendorffii]|eukprot:XP_002963504.2 ABC transporter F family member 5 [Selaginella moellendorffii]
MAMELGRATMVLGGASASTDFSRLMSVSSTSASALDRAWRRGRSALEWRGGSNRQRRERAWLRAIDCWESSLRRRGSHWKVSAVSTSVKEVAQEVESSSLPFNFLEEDDSEKATSKKGKGGTTGASSVSSGVRLEHISKTFKGTALLRDINWEVKKGEKVGLVGINGAGKTTQLKIISGEEQPDSGTVLKAKPNMKIAFLTQEFEVVPTRTLREEFLSAFKEQMEISRRIEQVQKALETATEDMALMGKLLDELDKLQKKAEATDLYDVDVKVNKVMPELGFSQDDNDRLVASYSGGWQMRMSLGKILLQEPDLLLLDEPTNHLDMDTIEWLEGYLKKIEVPMVVVSHDRAFLDQLCTKIVETDMGVSRTYEGNYSNYVQARTTWAAEQEMKWRKQQKEIAQAKENVSSANSGQATSAKRQLEKIQEKDLVEKPFEHKSIRFRFPEAGRSGRMVASVKDLTLQYGEKVLFKSANMNVERGEKLAIIGPNGCGKSTLLRLILGYEKPTRGDITLGEHRVVPNYFEQNQAEALDLNKTVLETVEEVAEDWRLDDIKGLLGKCNFKAEMFPRKAAFLSGGEKARLAFCKFMVKPSTLLVLDEPTNHLDIPTKEMLEEALREYHGTVLVVSHDRYFVRQIVNRVVEVKNGRLEDYNGDYNYYLEKNLEARRKELEREQELEGKAPSVKAKSKMSKAEKELQKKQKAQSYQQKNSKGKLSKNSKRWN